MVSPAGKVSTKRRFTCRNLKGVVGHGKSGGDRVANSGYIRVRSVRSEGSGNPEVRVLHARGSGGKGGRTDQPHDADQQHDARKLASEARRSVHEVLLPRLKEEGGIESTGASMQ